MRQSVYLETTVISYLTAWRSLQLMMAAHQHVTRMWWDEQRIKYDLFVSQAVVEEASSGDPGAARQPSRFFAGNISDGALRALGVLVALFQSKGDPMHRRHLVGIEEPESVLHPVAASVLFDSLTDASQLAHVVVTSHSADLLDNDTIPESTILAVLSEQAETRIGPLDEAGRSALRDHLFTAGELLRMDQLRPDPQRSAPRQLDLFERTHRNEQPYGVERELAHA